METNYNPFKTVYFLISCSHQSEIGSDNSTSIIHGHYRINQLVVVIRDAITVSRKWLSFFINEAE